MTRSLVVRLGAAALLCGPAAAHADHHRLTLDQAMALARARAPDVLVERARVREAEARRAGAELLVRENPELELAGGRRTAPGGEGSAGSGTDSGSEVGAELEVELTQMFELGGRRRARAAMADAAVERARLDASDAVRKAQLAVAIRFYQALHAREQLNLARESAGGAEAATRAIERRVQKGDAAALELNLARTASARARAAVRAAEADLDRLLSQLGGDLGFDPADRMELAGDLAAPPAARLERLLAGARGRPDVRALASEVREGEAEADLGRSLGWPDLGLRASYAREGDERIWLGGLVLRVPLFDRGQEARASGRARASRAALAATTLVRTVEREIRAAHARYTALDQAVRLLEAEAVPLIAESERLLSRSVETGLIGLGDYLALRRELIDARAEYLDRLLERAIAGVELQLGSGAMP